MINPVPERSKLRSMLSLPPLLLSTAALSLIREGARLAALRDPANAPEQSLLRYTPAHQAARQPVLHHHSNHCPLYTGAPTLPLVGDCDIDVPFSMLPP